MMTSRNDRYFKGGFSGLMIAAALLCGASAAQAAGSASYVQDGLIACWDGIENAGAGVHDGNPRLQSKSIDLGCWEVPSGLGFRLFVR